MRDIDQQLHEAAREGDVKQVQLLLKQGANPNARWDKEDNFPDNPGAMKGNTPLISICDEWGHSPKAESIAKVLLNAGTNINAQNAQGDTALISAVGNELLDMVQLLCGYEKQVLNYKLVNQKGFSAYTEAMLKAETKNNPKYVNILKKYGGDYMPSQSNKLLYKSIRDQSR